MFEFLNRIDAFALNRVFTPVAHYAQQRTLVISFGFAKLFCEIASVMIVAVALYAWLFVTLAVTVWTVVALFVALLVSVTYYFIATQLKRHLESSQAWRTEPLIAVYAYRAAGWYFPVSFIFAVWSIVTLTLYLLFIDGSQPVVVPTVDGAEPSAARIGSMRNYHILHAVSDVSEVCALYFMRVRPLPPAPPEEEVALLPQGA